MASMPNHEDGYDEPVSLSTESITVDGTPLRLRPARSLPPWIDSYEDRYGPPTEEQLRLLKAPERILHTQRNAVPKEPTRRVSKDGFVDWDDPQLGPAKDARSGVPHFLRYGRASKRGRRWDHLRTAEPVIISGHRLATSQPSPTWKEFLDASSWGHIPNEKSEVVDYDVLKKMQPSFDGLGPVLPFHAESKGSRRRKTLSFSKRLWIAMMRSSLSPLLFRLIVVVTSILALGVASRIFQREEAVDREGAERTQSLFAVAVDCLAIPYIGYMLYDEYTGKPVGLRSGVSKIRLILLDVLFIIFKSASTALAFESIVYHRIDELQAWQLSAVLGVFELVGLMSWTMNFVVNVFRTVERLGGGADLEGRLA
ncbi:DEHA2D15422p-like protein [Ophiocordyceps camponoti-floridani]|uniref:DEHA2D15422p-like protein n=1 Tax=Ophiocordyceps camponoti-floridani TaxID=2030778 RepID=A0A8H4Q5V6_9HYPO|nr:DEHA2D15422p-like protein [Ophiocordyceps camponoti-floridani]